ncbi:piggyBac transposable element-derived protein 3-like [Rhopalosiphum padi]|uniref:piggyBac transposable element-derived protein 3-like n=1 Tax=Rhopalosiphum padi TaxID=40932 RepID=UPI00298E8A25|nr:piggyBac transposable element-derived protein 3-like [Rhopalosiphum padi]
MGLVNISNIRKYWSPNLGNQIIQETMNVNQFEQIRQFIHFNNNNNMLPKTQVSHDRLHKIRPVIETLKKRFASIPLEEALSIDEQLCSTKARHYLKQYLPIKPHKWGYKFFVLCGVSSFSYNFEMYSGQENNDVNRYSWEPNFDASGNVVVRLCRIIPKNMNYKVYFDNYYTSVPLMVYMKNRQICSLGTVRRNRLTNVLLPNEKDFLKKPRGSSDYCLANINNQEVFATCWRDNKVVTLLSTFVEIDPMSKVKRFSKTENKTIEIDCQHIVSVYNKHMGGVDLLDNLLGRQKIKIRSRKWYLRIFYHLLDVTVVNSSLLHK